MGLSEKYPAYGGRGPGDFQIGIALGTITTIFALLRIYIRLRVNKFGTTSLIWFLSAYIFTTTSQTFASIAIFNGLGNHVEIVESKGNMRNYLLYSWLAVFFFSIAIPLGKCALCSFLIEMNRQGNPRIRLSLIIVGVLNVLIGFPELVIIWTQCNPPQSLWDPTRQGDCNAKRSTIYLSVVGAVAAVSDLYLAIIPAAMLIPLKLDLKLKIGLSFLMGVGVFAAAAAIVRAYAANSLIGPDATYASGILFCWGEIEEWIVLICMSIPPIWPLLYPIANRFILSKGSKTYPPTGAYASKGYNQFASTGAQGTILETTTIAITTNKAPATGVHASDSSTESLIDSEAQKTVRAHDGEGQGWIEMNNYKNS
ncbi:hypothetical protein N7495_008146 [Penicillium taxi]|uniref:uncharacterized protein n=1 Tax=Penicillium taxi TaxID=168475 RepID=UPI0025457657|nr:uncharacterized protein N7495_008146 [Penicillium taxi]KAJ5888105.1 hypothetical protein N7495_008146 [Penicillium taxi]